MTMATPMDLEFTPREYQVELLQKALKKNIIVCSGTGTGKTFISVLLIKELQYELMTPFQDGGKRCIFISKTVPLVIQQAEVLSTHLGLSVGKYSGDMGVDFWDREVWTKEFIANEILVMTSQILVNLLSQTFLKPNQINLLIIDECHHGVGGDPVTQIMMRLKDFEARPRILGLTAAVINGKSKLDQVEKKIRQLEVTLGAVVETPNNQLLAATFATNAIETSVIFHSATAYDGALLEILVYLNEVTKSIPTKAKEETFTIDDDDWFLMSVYGPNVKLSHVVQDLTYTASDLGLWCAYDIAERLLAELARVEDNELEASKDILERVKNVLNGVKARCQQLFNQHCTDQLHAMSYFTSEKVKRLVEVLREFNEEEKRREVSTNGNVHLLAKEKTMKGIVFVDRRVAAWMLSHHLNSLAEVDPAYSFLKTEPVMGHGADPSRYQYASLKNREQQKRIRNFRKGDCNLLIATRVVEEGMDIPTCNLVIRYDSPKDYRSYIQSKGRARSKDSHYILLLNSTEKELVLNEIKLYRTIEETLYKICHDRLPPTEDDTKQRFASWPLPSYYSGDHQGPCVSSVDAIGRVNWYCQLLPSDQLTTLPPIILFKKKYLPPTEIMVNHPFYEAFDMFDYLDDVDDIDFYYEDQFDANVHGQPLVPTVKTDVLHYKCAIKLPLNSPIKDIIVGDFMPSKKLAKQSVALKAVKELHEAGELNDNLLPIHKDPTEFLKQFIDIEEDRVPKDSSAPGSKKRRQKYKKKIASVLQDSGPVPFRRFYVYKISITSKQIGENATELNYGDSCFGIITSKKTFNEIEAFPLYSSDADIWVKIHLVECFCPLTNARLTQLKNFQVQLFEKLLKITGMFKPLDDQDSCYLIAPLLNDGTDNRSFIDWQLMEELSRFSFLDAAVNLPSAEQRRQFVYKEQNYKDAVVMPLYNDSKSYRLFTVKGIEHDASPLAKVPNNPGNFIDYYKFKYGIIIQCQDQPVLDSKQVQQCKNLLSLKDRRTKKKNNVVFNGKERPCTEFLIPELCTVVPIGAILLKQAVMLPSILYRYNSLCSADELGLQIIEVNEDLEAKLPYSQWSTVERTCQLESFCLYQRDTKIIETEIPWGRQYVRENEEMEEDYLPDNEYPPPSILLKALTSRAATDSMNLERMESLGDSFLKYATSIYLFCQHRRLDEGRLTLARSKIISNSHLYHLAKRQGLTEMMHTEIFSPHSNWLPPYTSIDETKAEILLRAGITFEQWKYAKHSNLCELTTNEIMKEIKIRADEAGKSVILEQPENNEVFDNFTTQMINDKSAADCVEALIGAFLIHVGPSAALQFMKWVNVKIFPKSLDDEEITDLDVPRTAYLNSKQNAGPKLLGGLNQFQTQIDYRFKDISFLVQAMTHPSYFKNLVTDCYQRLEFLGDAILDYLVTWQIYKDEHNFDPGKITDLRSALVNNETFARLAVKYHYDHHLKELNPKLFDSIRKFKQLLDDEEAAGDMETNLIVEGEITNDEEIEVPKALGDIFESVAGAIYLDSGLSLDAVWDVYSKMLIPLIDKYTEDIPIDPVREVHEIFPHSVFRKTELDDGNGNITYKSILELFPGLMCDGYGQNSKLSKRSAAKYALRNYKHVAMSVQQKFKEQSLNNH